MMPNLEIKIVPPVGTYDSFIDRNVNVPELLDSTFMIVWAVNPVISQHQGFKAVTAVSWGFGAVLGMR